MAVKKIITVPNPLLRQKSKPVVKISAKGGPASGWDKKIKSLTKDMADTLKDQRNPRGVGISAVQIGKPWRIFILYQNKKNLHFLNPKIISKSKKTLAEIFPEERRFMEGCLSVPGLWGFVNRPYKVKLEYLNLKGQKKTGIYKGTEASYVQHEIDHLDGILFVDRVLEQKGKIYTLEKDEEGKKELVEVKLV